MRNAIQKVGWVCVLTILMPACAPASPEGELHLDKIELPPGFHIHLYAEGISDARSMALGARGTLFVGTRKAGKIYALVDADDDKRVDRVMTLAEGLNMPNGVAFRNGALYVAEVSRILRYDDIESNLDDPQDPAVIRSDLPTEEHHGWKYIGFGPDGKLYVPVGAPCNVCKRDDERFASILRMDPDGTGLEVFARGIRNTVGFDFHPKTGELWFTNNGRDWMGDDLPPDTLHRAPKPGLHFGFPYCHGGEIPDPEYGEERRCEEFAPPVVRMPAHVAPLGMTFYRGTLFPQTYRHQIFVAEHGSWNRTTPIGYRITQVQLRRDGPPRYRVFARGWLEGITAWGRPVDVLELGDGSLLISDDRSGVIYRIRYQS